MLKKTIEDTYTEASSDAYLLKVHSLRLLLIPTSQANWPGKKMQTMTFEKHEFYNAKQKTSY